MRTRLTRTALAVVQALACLTVAGCGGGNSGTESLEEGSTVPLEEGAVPLDEVTVLEQAQRWRWQVIDRIAPSVKIDSITGVGSTGFVGMSGTASDNKRLYLVRWVNDRGGSGSA